MYQFSIFKLALSSSVMLTLLRDDSNEVGEGEDVVSVGVDVRLRGGGGVVVPRGGIGGGLLPGMLMSSIRVGLGWLRGGTSGGELRQVLMSSSSELSEIELDEIVNQAHETENVYRNELKLHVTAFNISVMDQNNKRCQCKHAMDTLMNYTHC